MWCHVPTVSRQTDITLIYWPNGRSLHFCNIRGRFVFADLLADSIAAMSGDLSSMTAPPFILSPVSLTEYPGIFI
jgi:hypothetical protein